MYLHEVSSYSKKKKHNLCLSITKIFSCSFFCRLVHHSKDYNFSLFLYYKWWCQSRRANLILCNIWKHDVQLLHIRQFYPYYKDLQQSIISSIPCSRWTTILNIRIYDERFTCIMLIPGPNILEALRRDTKRTINTRYYI